MGYVCVHSLMSTSIQRTSTLTHSDLEVLGAKVSTQQTAQCASFIFPRVKHSNRFLKFPNIFCFCFNGNLSHPTGIRAECQQTRSQLQNRDTAMHMLKARIYQSIMGKETEQRHTARKQQVSDLQ